ncbi:MAG: holo-[acyl-carrier-protein] synthase [Anaerolineaceae bacterium 4572_78]|nr:MAG: holo-[acyl-carrier-protein] synthase [Anaerolineaceae bacterium 4572_78]
MTNAIGVDIIENHRIELAIQKHGSRFLNRVFTSQELQYCKGRIPSLAVRWAAKESVGKAFGTGISGISFTDIEVVCDEHGKPFIVLHGNAKRLASEKGFNTVHVSLSHTRETSIAFVVID